VGQVSDPTATFATPRIAAGALFVHGDRILLVHKTYGNGPGPHASGAPWGIDPPCRAPFVVLRGHLEALCVHPVCSCDSRIRSGGHHLAAHDGGAKAPTRLPGW
jgi:hypothetical protein